MEEQQRERIVRVVSEVLGQRRNGKPLPDRWLEVLRGCLEGKTYREIDELVHFSAGTSKGAANSNLWLPLSDILGVKVGKANCIGLLRDNFDTLAALVATTAPSPRLEESLPPAALAEPIPSSSSTQTGTAYPVTLSMSGQSHSQEVAVRAIVEKIRQRRRLVVLTGLPKTGKTLLVNSLLRTLEDDFNQELLYSANQVGTLDILSRRVLNTVKPWEQNGHHQESSVLENLVDILHHQNILLAITEADVLYREGDLAGRFNDAAGDYESWLEHLAISPSAWSGCLIWSSQAPPHCLHSFFQQSLLDQQSSLSVYHYTFPTLEDVDVATLASNYGQSAVPPAWEELVRFCGGHQDWIRRSLQRIEREYDGDIESFLCSPQLWDPELHGSLQGVSPKEKDVLTWVVLSRLTPTLLERLLTDAAQRDRVINSLEQRRLLLWNSRHKCYQVTALALRHILAAFYVEELKQEFCSETFDRLHRYPLTCLETSAYQQHWHRQYLLEPLAEYLRGQYPDPESQKVWLTRLLTKFRATPCLGGDYATSNVLNIVGCWGLELADCDLSGLFLDQLNLRTLNPHGLNLRECRFGSVAWPLLLKAPLLSSMSASGDTIVVSDRQGLLLVWRKAADTPVWNLMDCLAAGQAIQALAVSEAMIVFAVEQTVYCWWPDSGLQTSEPDELTQLDRYEFASAVYSLDIIRGKHATKLAIASRDGRIHLLNLATEQPLSVDVYSDQAISLSPDGSMLAGLGSDNNIRCWSILEDGLQSISTESFEQSFEGVFVGLGWQGTSLCAAESLDSANQVSLRPTNGESWPLRQGKCWVKAVFSGDGHWVAGQQLSGVIEIRPVQRNQISDQQFVINNNMTPVQLTHDGGRLLLKSEAKVQLWETEHRECLWEIAATPDTWSIASAGWEDITELPAAEKKLWRLQS